MNLQPYRQITPSLRETDIAREIAGFYAGQTGFPKFTLTDTVSNRTTELPESVAGILMHVLKAIACGRGVTVIPEDTELTSAEAAEILRVSRPFLVKLLEDGHIPFRKVGKHRRILSEDVMRYKAGVDKRREETLEALTAQAQEDNMGY